MGLGELQQSPVVERPDPRRDVCALAEDFGRKAAHGIRHGPRLAHHEYKGRVGQDAQPEVQEQGRAGLLPTPDRVNRCAAFREGARAGFETIPRLRPECFGLGPTPIGPSINVVRHRGRDHFAMQREEIHILEIAARVVLVRGQEPVAHGDAGHAEEFRNQ